MIVQACLNGARAPGFHPALPTTPDALVADAGAAVAAGAAEIHLHIRGDDGRETLDPGTVDRTIRALRHRLPGTFIGVSTGAWIEKDDAHRLALIAGWSEPPDYASVNLGEADAPALFRLLTEKHIGVEAGLANVVDTDRFIALGLARACLRILIEIDEQDEATAFAVANEMRRRLEHAEVRKPVLIHGMDGTVWPFVRRAAAEGLSTRVGLEDGRTLPDGRTAASNAEIVRAAVAIMGRQGG